jgi:hypothetical protein
MAPLILKRGSPSRRRDENGVVVGRIFKAQVAPTDRPSIWASGHAAGTIARARHGYEPTPEAAMAAFAESRLGKE